MTNSNLRFTAALIAGLGVVLGAFGAHALQTAVSGWGLTETEQARRLDIWETAVRYQMYHALTLLVLSVLPDLSERPQLRWAVRLFLCGMLVFCGCLYLLVLTDVRILGAVVPLGGVCLIAGWILMAWEARQIRRDSGRGSAANTS